MRPRAVVLRLEYMKTIGELLGDADSQAPLSEMESRSLGFPQAAQLVLMRGFLPPVLEGAVCPRTVVGPEFRPRFPDMQISALPTIVQ